MFSRSRQQFSMTSFGNGASAYAVDLGTFCIKSPRYACYFWTDTWGASNKHHPMQCKQTSLWLYLPMGPNTGHNYSATAKCAVFLPLTNYVVVSHKIVFATVEFSFFNNCVVLSVYHLYYENNAVSLRKIYHTVSGWQSALFWSTYSTGMGS